MAGLERLLNRLLIPIAVGSVALNSAIYDVPGNYCPPFFLLSLV